MKLDISLHETPKMVLTCFNNDSKVVKTKNNPTILEW